MHICECVYLLLSVICWEDRGSQHEPQWVGWDLDYSLLYLWEGLFYRLKGDSHSYGAWHTNQFTQISRGQGGGILISHCFWPDQHTPSPVKGPPAVYNFQELDKPLDHREISLLLTALWGYKLQIMDSHAKDKWEENVIESRRTFYFLNLWLVLK